MRNGKSGSWWISLVLFLLLPAPVPAASLPDAAIRQAADAGLEQFLQAIPPADVEHFGFAAPQELARAELGEPFRVYALWPLEILAFAAGEQATLTPYPTDLWHFPVRCDDSVRTLLTVDRLDGVWQAVDLGGLSPALEMEDAALIWPADDGYEIAYVRVFQTGHQFLQVTRNAVPQWVPLESTAQSLGLLREDEAFAYAPHDVDILMQALAPHVRSGLEAEDE